MDNSIDFKSLKVDSNTNPNVPSDIIKKENDQLKQENQEMKQKLSKYESIEGDSTVISSAIILRDILGQNLVLESFLKFLIEASSMQNS